MRLPPNATVTPDAQAGTDAHSMRHALTLVERAQREDDEIPVGALVVDAEGR